MEIWSWVCLYSHNLTWVTFPNDLCETLKINQIHGTHAQTRQAILFVEPPRDVVNRFLFFILNKHILKQQRFRFIFQCSHPRAGGKEIIFIINKAMQCLFWEKHTQVLFLWNFYIDLYWWIIYKYLRFFCDILKKECKQSFFCDGVHIRFSDEYFCVRCTKSQSLNQQKSQSFENASKMLITAPILNRA